MSCFIDTSAFIALADPVDPNHHSAVAASAALARSGQEVVTTNYVVVETISLLHHRQGIQAVKAFIETMLPVVEIEWIDQPIHHHAVEAMVAGSRRGPSLVDCVSFEFMLR